MAEAGKIKTQPIGVPAPAMARVERTRSIRDINTQVQRIANSARNGGSYERFEDAMNIAANYRSNIRNTNRYQNGEWINGVYSGQDMQFPYSTYARTRRNNR